MDTKNNQDQGENKSINPFEVEGIDLSALRKSDEVEQVNMTSDDEKLSLLISEKEALQKELETTKSQYLRLAADFDNYRKRNDQEKLDSAKFGICEAVRNLLPVFDTLDRAYLSFQTLDDVEKLRDSFSILYRQVQDSLAKLQVLKIKTAGEKFDPNYHEAVMQEETTEFPDNTIMMELQCGYILSERVIRPSMVKVASNSSDQKAESSSKSE